MESQPQNNELGKLMKTFTHLSILHQVSNKKKLIFLFNIISTFYPVSINQ